MLIRQTYDDIYRFIRWKVHDADLAWDLSQMTYEKAWTKLNTYRGEEGNFKAWLLAIAHHLCIDYIRSKAVRQAGLNQSLDERLAAEGDFLDGVLLREDVRQVYQAIQELPDSQRDALILRYKNELTYSEIAAVTEESEATVKSRIRRALIRLRDSLGGRADQTVSKISPSPHLRKETRNER
ncbi:RNA polymerase sigma factor [Gorillibacterium massiliense]|uniref:RNA polymerase sigma factor n=1 Tax=Gorillibacterium massiliense TaxID=1280390 RepID=UPI00059272FC|nr:RNA polymerase sigma factor [Gorillibacterium massiliense]